MYLPKWYVHDVEKKVPRRFFKWEEDSLYGHPVADKANTKNSDKQNDVVDLQTKAPIDIDINERH